MIMIDNNKEYILCAAVWYLDLELSKYPTIPKEQYLPINIDKGIVFCGHRHIQCIRQMNIITGLKQHEASNEVQGFLTSKNRFVDRLEAAKIASDLGQIITEGVTSVSRLYSEDLY